MGNRGSFKEDNRGETSKKASITSYYQQIDQRQPRYQEDHKMSFVYLVTLKKGKARVNIKIIQAKNWLE